MKAHNVISGTRRTWSIYALGCSRKEGSELANSGRFEHERRWQRSGIARLALELSEQLLAKLGEQLVITLQNVDTDRIDALRIVLEQEVLRYNNLHSTMKQSLVQLKEAIGGRRVMTESLDAVFRAMLVLRVPSEWLD